MAKANLIYPFEALYGKIKAHDNVYMRTSWGRCIIQRTPRILSEKRRAVCEAFGKKYGTNRKKNIDKNTTDPAQCSVNAPLMLR